MASSDVAIDVPDNIDHTIKPMNEDLLARFGIFIGPYEDPDGLTIILLTIGTVLALIGLGAPIYPPNPCSRASVYISGVYVFSHLITFLYGIGLVGFSYWIPQAPVCRIGIKKTAAPIPIYRARIAKAFLSRSILPVLLVVALGFTNYMLRK